MRRMRRARRNRHEEQGDCVEESRGDEVEEIVGRG